MEMASNRNQEDASDAKGEKWRESIVIGRMVHHFGFADTELPNPLSIFVTKIVYSYVSALLKDVGLLDGRFTGKVLPCGSFLEGSKIGYPDEYDFMYELDTFPAAHIRLEPVPPVTYSPRREGDLAPHGYFRLFQNNLETMESDRCLQLQSSSLQQDFLSTLQRAASLWNHGILNLQDTECNGPAVTMYVDLEKCGFRNFIAGFKDSLNKVIGKYASEALRQCKIMEARTIKLDIALAIPVLLSEDEIRQASIDVVSSVLQSGNLDCHVVLSGDFWKLSLAQHEARLLMKLCGVKWKHSSRGELEYQPNMDCYGNDDDLRPLLLQDLSTASPGFVSFRQQIARRHCLKSLKHIRDMMDSSTIREASLLPSYPLKVSFLHECIEHPRESDWTVERLGRRMFNILDRIETEGKVGTLTSCFMTNVPILREGNKGYLDARRVKNCFKASADKSLKRSILHTVILLFQLTASVVTLWAAVKLLHCPVTFEPPCSMYSPAIMISTVVEFLFGLFGTLWCLCSRFCLSRKSESNMLYRLFICPLFLHFVSSVTPITLFILTIKYIAILYPPTEVCIIIILFQSIFCFIVTFNLVLVFIRGKGRCRDRCSKFIFFDHLYDDCLSPNRYINERTYTHYFADSYTEGDSIFYV